MFPDAMNALECMTGHGKSDAWPVWVTFWLCGATIVGYICIAVRWFRVFGINAISLSLVGIFILCVFCGYAPVMAAIWWPNTAYTLRVLLMNLLIASNIGFLVFSSGKKFMVAGLHEQLGRAYSDGDMKRVVELQKQVDVIKRGFKEVSENLR